MKYLAKNKIEFNHDLCQNIDKPTLQVLYQQYCTVNDICHQVDQMVKDRTWKGTTINKTEITSLFFAKTTWHGLYWAQMPATEKHDNMRAWLTEAEDTPSDIDLWGEAQDHYMLKDLNIWLKKKVRTKGKVVKKGTGKAIMKGKAKVVADQGTAKGKEKVVEPKAAKSHKKKSTAG